MIPILDKGYIRVIDHLGGDVSNVNAAKASYAKAVSEIGPKEEKLLSYLARNAETTPLRHTYIQMEIKAPEFVARQWYKHVVGCEHAFKDLPWSEVSQRYSEVAEEIYVPNGFRKPAGEHSKQESAVAGSDEVNQTLCNMLYDSAINQSYKIYQTLLNEGVAKEQARLVLPFATYTTWVWTASLQACVHFAALRNHPKAQWEIQEYAKIVEEIILEIAPISAKVLLNQHPLRANGV